METTPEVERNAILIRKQSLLGDKKSIESFEAWNEEHKMEAVANLQRQIEFSGQDATDGLKRSKVCETNSVHVFIRSLVGFLCNRLSATQEVGQECQRTEVK